MIMLYNKKENCCGCTACLNICPKSAIVMLADQEGFLYPHINNNMCIECGLCQKVCAFQNGYNTNINYELPYVYAVKHKDESVRMSSTSGGIFTAISDFILEKGGVIFGAAFDENMNVIHQKAETKIERDRFKGSKYVQSDLKNIFVEIKNLLNNGRYVLFTGTPCQVSGLKTYLGNTISNKLFLCDIVCHGTPSPLLWKQHISFSEKKEKSKIVKYYCRYKAKGWGWHYHNELSVFQNGKQDYKSALSQKHKVLFYSNNILRPSCYECKYTNLKRPSDITIADFWGIEKSIPDFDDNMGISLVLVNTPQGQNLFENIKDNLEVRKSNTIDCLQPQLQYPSKPSQNREEFWENYKKHGYEYVIKKYTSYGFNNQLKIFLIKVLRKTKLINLAKKILKKGY